MCDPCIVIEISQQGAKQQQQRVHVPIKKCNQDDSDSQGKSFSTDTATTPYIVSETLVQSKSSSSSIDLIFFLQHIHNIHVKQNNKLSSSHTIKHYKKTYQLPQSTRRSNQYRWTCPI